MQSLNSTSNTRRAVIVSGVGMFIAFLFLVPMAAFATSYTVTITSPSSGSVVVPGSTITVSGTVSPPPSVNGTNIAVSILAPNGEIATAAQFLVSPSTGAYSGSVVTGGPNFAVNGTYTVSVNYDNAPASITVTYGSTVTPPSGTGTTTTVVVSSEITVVSSLVTTISAAPVTTTIVTTAPGVTTVVNSVTTVVSSSVASDSTALAIGAVGVIIAIIAAVLAVLAMRKK